MKLSNLLVVSAAIAAFFGIGLLVVTGPLLAIYGITLDKTGTVVAQLFGSSLIAFAVLNWFARDIADPEARRAVILANLAGNAVGFVVILLGQLSGIANQLGWSNVAIYALLTLAWVYVLYTQRETA
jgi:uncharacterized membrane protein YfcA